MNLSLYITKDYRKNDAFAVQKNKPNSNPNKANFKCPQTHQRSGKKKGVRNFFWVSAAGKDIMLFMGNPILA